MNTVVLVGKLYEEPIMLENQNGVKYAKLKLAVTRNYKNAEGVYETDFIDIKTYLPMAQNVTEWCSKGDTLGIKGRVQTSQEDNNLIEIIAEKVTFLTNNPKAPKKEEE